MLALSNDQRTALAQRHIMRRLFIWFDALDLNGVPDPVGFWDDVGIVELDGRTYHGSGNVVSVATLNATGDLSIPGLQIVISNIETAALALVRASQIAQRGVTVSLGIYDVAARALIPPLFTMFNGVVDNIEVKTPASGERSSVTLTCESISRALTISGVETRSPASCAQRAPADKSYDYTAGQRADGVAVTAFSAAANPWTLDHVGVGRCYARTHYIYDPELVRGRLPWKFVAKGIRLYDPRKDSTVPGGSGSHRYDQLATTNGPTISRSSLTTSCAESTSPTAAVCAGSSMASRAPPPRNCRRTTGSRR
jgi:hypothetical protein